MKRHPLLTFLLYAAVVLLALSIVLPIAWLFIMSISQPTDLTTLPLKWFPETINLDQYKRLLTLEEGSTGETFLYALRNSTVVAVSATLISVLAAIPAAYSFSRFPGRQGLLYGTLAVYMMPPVAFVLPLYLTFSHLGLLNSSWALIIVYCTMLLPFATWLLKNNFDLLPYEIEQAAIIDGASQLQVIWHIALPLIKPALGAALLFALLMAWDEFFYALIYTNDLRAKTLPVAIGDFAAGRATDYGLISAVGMLAALPPLVAALFLQRSLVSGLAAGGTKG
ncbi:carbohydrate ABC transporter permease [Leeia oryzae]|uniref:carbohydrate ABC transporter permease n=1 Tax=Leeia oryzae TaxID=356662 RepID=UPI0003649900|nr:carbohydrate ABC transporter permease [Leeia oryzae]